MTRAQLDVKLAAVRADLATIERAVGGHDVSTGWQRPYPDADYEVKAFGTLAPAAKPTTERRAGAPTDAELIQLVLTTMAALAELKQGFEVARQRRLTRSTN